MQRYMLLNDAVPSEPLPYQTTLPVGTVVVTLDDAQAALAAKEQELARLKQAQADLLKYAIRTTELLLSYAVLVPSVRAEAEAFLIRHGQAVKQEQP